MTRPTLSIDTSLAAKHWNSDSSPVRSAGSSLPGHGSPVLSRRSSSGSDSQRTPGESAVARALAAAGKLAVLMGANQGLALLRQGVENQFSGALKPFADVGMSCARTFGLAPAAESGPRYETFAALKDGFDESQCLAKALMNRIADQSASEIDADRPDLAVMLNRMRVTGEKIGASLKCMTLADYKAHRSNDPAATGDIQRLIGSWQTSTQAPYEKLRDTMPDDDPLKALAVHAFKDANEVGGKTMLRMGLANAGSALFNLTLGPLVAATMRQLGLEITPTRS